MPNDHARNSAGWGDTDQLLRAIVASATNVRRRPITCSIANCPHCQHEPGPAGAFKLHGFRRRQFLVVVQRYVHKVHSLLPRWRCPDCRRTFTEYPTFAVSHKRYTLTQIANRAFLYLTEARASYRTCVRLANQPIFHGGERIASEKSGPSLDYTTLAHASLFNWMSSFTSDDEATCPGFQPAPRKYMSEERKSVLANSHQVLSKLLHKSPPRN